MKRKYLLFSLLLAGSSLYAQEWPAVRPEARPATRWWWLGSAVDATNLTYNLEEYAKAGLGGVEITPIYGVQGNDKNNLPFLSPQWMNMLQHTEAEGKRIGIEVDMNTGTGWPFGGPHVSMTDAATKAIFQSYQVEGGKEITLDLKVEEERQRPVATLSRVMAYNADNKQCLNLTSKAKNGQLQWKAPAGHWNIITLYIGKTFQKVKRAAPGGEGYVMNHLDKGAVKRYFANFDKAFKENKTNFPHTFFNDSYEVYGADWTPDFLEQFARRRGYKLEEHFPEFIAQDRNETTARIVSDYRETISDLLIENFSTQWTNWAHGHGSITRNQAHGSPANLIDTYASVDIPECEGFGLSQFHIKGLRQDSLTRKNDSDLSMLKYASSAAHIAGKPYTSSETFTWLTEHFRTSLSQCKPDMDLMFVSGVNHMFFHGTPYSLKLMPSEVLGHLLKLAQAGATIIFTENYPQDVPGYGKLEARRKGFAQLQKQLPEVSSFNETVATLYQKGIIITGNNYQSALEKSGVVPEEMKTRYGLQCIRRSHADGHHYFISSLQEKGVNDWITLAVPAESVMLFNPMTGEKGKAQTRKQEGKTQVRLQLHSGESVILQTFNHALTDVAEWKYVQEQPVSLSLDHGWKLHFAKSTPQIEGSFDIDTPSSWTEIAHPNAPITMATGVYTNIITVPHIPADDWILDLGDVRESARVRINGQDAGTAWAVPYQLKVGKWLKPGDNKIEIEVTNLPANRIADMDRRGEKWRIFNEINVVNLQYKPVPYTDWQPLPSGLNGSVRLIPVTYK